MAIMPDGKILLIGESGFYQAPAVRKMWAARHTADGAIDATFGEAADLNVVELPVQATSARARAVVVLSDGKAVVAGIADGQAVVVRMQPNGALDTFADNRTHVKISFRQFGAGSEAYSLAAQADGKIVVAGRWIESFANGTTKSEFGVARLNANGTPDASFSADGVTTVDFTPHADEARAVLIQPDGKIVVAGFADLSVNTVQKFAAARLNADGAPDATFGGAGRFTTGDAEIGAAYAAALQTDGRIVLVGSNAGYPGACRITGGGGGGQTVIANKTRGDFDGDRRADLALFRPSSGEWYVSRSIDDQMQTAPFGLNGDKIVTGDYDNDSKADYALYRPSDATWYILQSSNGQTRTARFGLAADVPAPADYDGDGKTDIAVFRPSNGTWYVLRSSDAQITVLQFGLNGDIPAARDYDGDGKADFAVFRPSDRNWYVRRTDGSYAAQIFGLSDDLPSN